MPLLPWCTDPDLYVKPEPHFATPILRICQFIAWVWSALESEHEHAVASEDRQQAQVCEDQLMRLYKALVAHRILAVIFKTLEVKKAKAADMMTVGIDSIIELAVRLFRWSCSKLASDAEQHLFLLPAENEDWLVTLWGRMLMKPTKVPQSEKDLRNGRHYWDDGAYNKNGEDRGTFDRHWAVENLLRFVDMPAVSSLEVTRGDARLTLSQLHIKAIAKASHGMQDDLLVYLKLDPPLSSTTWCALVSEEQWRGHQFWLELAAYVVSQQTLVMHQPTFDALLLGTDGAAIQSADNPAENREAVFRLMNAFWSASDKQPQICLLLCRLLRSIDEVSLSQVKGLPVPELCSRIIYLIGSYSTGPYSSEIVLLEYVIDKIILGTWMSTPSAPKILKGLMRSGSTPAMQRYARMHACMCSHTPSPTPSPRCGYFHHAQRGGRQFSDPRVSIRLRL